MSHFTEEAVKRFWSRVDKRTDAECWPWLGSKSGEYGTIRDGGKAHRAHKFAWSVFHDKPFPDDLWGLHNCDNPICVNPHHIHPGTPRENNLDQVVRGKHNCASRTHCIHGHLFDEKNTCHRFDGSRGCRACANIESRNRYYRRLGRIAPEKGGSRE